MPFQDVSWCCSGQTGHSGCAAESWVMDGTCLGVFPLMLPSLVAELKEVLEEFVLKGLDFRLLSAASHGWFM